MKTLAKERRGRSRYVYSNISLYFICLGMRHSKMDVAPSSKRTKDRVAKTSKGHFPPSFLIKWGKDK